MTEAATITKDNARALLDDIQVPLPENQGASRKKYLCALRAADRMPLTEDCSKCGAAKGQTCDHCSVVKGQETIAALEQFEKQIGVGPATFMTRSFEWEGKGENARQIVRAGCLQEFTEDQVAEVRKKLQFRYVRVQRGKDKDGVNYISGWADIDASDGGINISEENRQAVFRDGVQIGADRPPAQIRSRLSPGDQPLKNFIVFTPVFGGIQAGRDQVYTVAQLRELLAEAERDTAAEPTTDKAAIDEAETGKGGKRPSTAIQAPPRDEKLLQGLSKADGKRSAVGGYQPG